MPDDVITMNSRFAVWHGHSDETVCYTIVYPDEESAQCGKISVLSPMGQALLGARAGDQVFWISTDGPVTARVRRLNYQPEATGHHRL